MDVGEHVVGLGDPTQGTVTQGFAHLALLYQVMLPREVAGDVAEGGCGVQEVALHVLGFGHQVPCVVQVGVVLVSGEPFLVFRVTAFTGLAFGLFLDGVQRDGLLHLLDGAVKTAAGLRSLGVGSGFGRMHVQALGVVVLVIVHHLLHLLVVVGLAVEVDVVLGGERVPET